MPKVQANGITINYEQQGAVSHSFSSPIWPPTTPAMPSRSPTMPSSLPVFPSTRAAPARATSRQATYSTELFADDIAGLSATLGVDRAHVSGPVARRGDRTVACCQISEAGQVAVAAQLLAEERPLPQDRGGRLAEHGQGPWTA